MLGGAWVADRHLRKDRAPDSFPPSPGPAWWPQPQCLPRPIRPHPGRQSWWCGSPSPPGCPGTAAHPSGTPLGPGTPGSPAMHNKGRMVSKKKKNCETARAGRKTTIPLEHHSGQVLQAHMRRTTRGEWFRNECDMAREEKKTRRELAPKRKIPGGRTWSLVLLPRQNLHLPGVLLQ